MHGGQLYLDGQRKGPFVAASIASKSDDVLLSISLHQALLSLLVTKRLRGLQPVDIGKPSNACLVSLAMHQHQAQQHLLSE